MRKKRDEYQQWILENENVKETVHEEAENKGRDIIPLFSVCMFSDGTVSRKRKACLAAVRKQSYDNWELIEITQKHSVEIWHRVHGEYVLFISANDLLAENALQEIVCKLNEAEGLTKENVAYDFIYSDEDIISANGRKRSNPFFKPDWSPDLFWCMRYTGQLAVYRTSLAKQAVEGMKEKAVSLSEAWQYEFLLRFLELTDNRRIGHIAKVLYHTRIAKRMREKTMGQGLIDGETEEQQEICRAKKEALNRSGLQGTVEAVPDMEQYRVVYECPGQPLVSIIIPSKDNASMLEQCIHSIETQTNYKNYEIILVDNGSTEENRAILAAYAKEHGVNYHYEKMEFNFSRMCNLGAGKARGEYLLFLNDDIEIIQKDWMARLLGQAILAHSGAVGAKLLYPNSDLLQHAGIANMKMGPSHYLTGKTDRVVYYFGRNRLDYNCMAVTGACLMVSKEKFGEIGGFEETLAITYNDVDLCFKLYEKGYYNVIRNDVCLCHHESVSRGLDTLDEKKMKRLIRERERMLGRHPQIGQADPFYSPHLAQDKTDFRLHVHGDSLKVSRCMGMLKHPEKYAAEFAAHIDSIVLDREIVIRGWYYWKNDTWMRRSRVYIVLKNRQGVCVYYETCRQEREDVAEALRIQTLESGFSCRIPCNNLTSEDDRYQLGLLLEAPCLGIKKLHWCEGRFIT